MIEIETPRLILRDYVEDDWSDVYAYASIADVSPFEEWAPLGEVETRQRVAENREKAGRKPRLAYNLAMVLKEDGRVIGDCSLRLKEAGAGQATLGYIAHPAYRNRGLAAEAAAALIEFGFSKLGLVSIVAGCDVENTPSIRVMEKAGMKRVERIEEDRPLRGLMRPGYRYEIKKPWIVCSPF